MTSQVGVQRVGFTVTDNRPLHKTKLHACGCGESPCYLSRAAYITCKCHLHNIVLLRYVCAFIGSASYSPEIWMNFVVSCKGDITRNWGCYHIISPSVFIHKYRSEG